MTKKMALAVHKKCFTCQIWKSVIFFYRSNDRYFQRECKECNRLRKTAWHKTESGKLSSANTKLKRRFGITLKQYEQMYKAQDGKCLICLATESYDGHRLAVDHCHKTGKIRALLCKSCNTGIGNLKENINNLTNAIKYLQKYGI